MKKTVDLFVIGAVLPALVLSQPGFAAALALPPNMLMAQAAQLTPAQAEEELKRKKPPAPVSQPPEPVIVKPPAPVVQPPAPVVVKPPAPVVQPPATAIVKPPAPVVQPPAPDRTSVV